MNCHHKTMLTMAPSLLPALTSRMYVSPEYAVITGRHHPAWYHRCRTWTLSHSQTRPAWNSVGAADRPAAAAGAGRGRERVWGAGPASPPPSAPARALVRSRTAAAALHAPALSPGWSGRGYGEKISHAGPDNPSLTPECPKGLNTTEGPPKKAGHCLDCWKYQNYFFFMKSVLWIRIRYPVLFYPLDPGSGSGINFSGSRI
jgi:hypothetical protein